MLTIPTQLQQVLAREPATKATQEDVARIRALQPLAVPDSYFEFVTQYGCPQFDTEDLCWFDYQYEEPGFVQSFQGAISHFLAPEHVQRYYSGLVVDEAEDLPKFPNFMIPIGLDYGQSCILLECGGESDRIWFWEFQGEAWGDGDNVRLGKVAPTLQAFLDGLRVGNF